MRTILLSRAGTDFDSAAQIPIGPWCFVGAEEVYSQWEDLPFTDIFVEQNKLAVANMTYRLSSFMVSKLVTQLNQRHNRNFSPMFWRFILMPWISWVVDLTWRTWLYTQAFIDNHPDESFSFPVYSADIHWDFRSYQDFYVRGFCGEAFSAWLFSQIFDRLAPETWRRGPQPFVTPVAQIDDSELLKVRRWDALRRLLLPRNFTHVAGIRYEKLIFGPLIRMFPRRAATPLNPDNGDYQPEQEFPGDYLDVLSWISEVMMPRYLDKDFDAMAEKAFSKRFVPGRLLVGASDQSNIPERFQTAAAIEHGERIVISQHGGGSGIFAIAAYAARMEYKQHAFFSWGWKAHADCQGNFRPLASPLLSKLRDRHKETEKTLILVGTRMTMDIPRILATPESVEWIEYRREKIKFIEGLKQDPKDHFQYRPYKRAAISLEDEAYVRRHVANLKILDGDLHKALLRGRLLVIDHPTTTLNVAMAANIPTIAFWHDSAWPICDQAKPVIDALRNCGVLFEDASDAAVQANRVWDDATAWWHSSDVQAARKDFCDQYALTSRTWQWDWLKALYNA